MEPTYAIIDELPVGLPRPRWSVLIPCYNCAGFLEKTLASVLTQALSTEEMEILVVDDCSTRDDPAEVVERLGKGRVRFLRQSKNVGKVRNFETGLEASRGHLIHQLHGDDLVLPGFYEAMDAAFTLYPEVGAFFCESDYIDEKGRITGRTGIELDETGVLPAWLPKIAVSNRIQTPSVVVRRGVYETLGGFDRRLDCTEDWEMWIRIANRFPFGFCVEARAQYRSSSGNTSSLGIISGAFGTEIKRGVLPIVDSYLPMELLECVRDARDLSQAYFFAANIPGVLRNSGIKSWLMICHETLRFSKRPEIIRRIVSLTLRALMKRELLLVPSGQGDSL
jgi:glycosyltransferase involved in cell wall biosynthesis